MGVYRENPFAVAVSDGLELDILSQVNELHLRIENAEQSRREWMDKQKTLLEQRRGIRKTTRMPWVGANNDNWPLTDAVIRRWKPGIVALVLDADPVAWFFAMSPSDVDAARSAQSFYHWLFTTLPNVHKTVFALADTIAQYGLAFTRQGWEYRTHTMCRVVRARSLFPGGIEQSYQMLMESAAAQAQQTGAQLDQSQLPSLEQFVRDTLIAEYGLDEETDGDMLTQTVGGLLEGKETLKIYTERVVADRPSWKLLSPMDVVVPTRTADACFADYACITHRLKKDDVARMAHDGLFDLAAAKEVIERLESRSEGNAGGTQSGTLTIGRQEHDLVLDRAEGVNQITADDPDTDNFWEIYANVDVNGDGLNEKVVLWYWPAANTAGGRPATISDNMTEKGGVVLSVMEYPYPFEEWPIVGFEFEHTVDRPYTSRGVSELLSTFQKAANRMHNARLDAIQIMLSPVMQMRSTAGQLVRQLRWRPGLIVPVQSVGDIAPVVTDHAKLQGFLQEELSTRSMAEQYVGIFDPAILSQNAAERRTATEVEAVTSQVEAVFTQDATLFQRSMAQVHRQLWQLWLEFGPEETYFRVMEEEQPRLARKSEIAGQYDISPAGTPSNTNKALALARAREAIQIFFLDESGVIDKSRLAKHYFDLTDRNLAKQVVRSPEEAQAVQMLLNAAEAKTGVRPSSF